MQNGKSNLIVDKTVAFSLDVITYCEILESCRKYVIAKQLLRAGTAIGSNVFEAQRAESKADFIHKMKIADKEANETAYWLLLCKGSKTYPTCEALDDQLLGISMILSKIIAACKRKSS
jgi:four helix bundle protein